MKYPVTIIIPVYCATQESLEWLGECIDAAIATEAQIVLWDDGSPLDISSMIKASGLHADIANIGFHATNRGPSYARNRAVELAATDLIFPLDCDDVIRPDAIRELYIEWLRGDGTPVFPDVYKFGTDNVAHYRLLDWSCDLQLKKLGIAPVNVLHSKRQWEAIGGWDEQFTKSDIYEDAEYNARLFFSNCARNYHKPLIGYRQHMASRIHINRHKAGIHAARLLQHIGGYIDMGCCGKKRKSPSNAPKIVKVPSIINKSAVTANTEKLPGEDGNGKILVTYVGGEGKLRHYYRGVYTKYPYKVQYGMVLYVDLKDSRLPTELETKSQFVQVVK